MNNVWDRVKSNFETEKKKEEEAANQEIISKGKKKLLSHINIITRTLLRWEKRKS